ncbi:MAG: hypothetical protein ACRD08_16505, partial [Acidimicrobiales bacterium]
MTPTVLAWLATYALHSTLLLGAVALLTSIIVTRDAWRDTLWKAALLGALLTTTIQVASHRRPLVRRWELRVVTVTTDGPGNATGSERRDAVRARGHEQTGALPAEPIPASVDKPGIRNGLSWSWPRAILGLWALAAVALLARLAARQHRLRWLLRGRREIVDGRAVAILAELRRNAGIWRPVRLSAAPRCATPLALGTAEI